MDLEVVGRHALLFDDDAMASFVNSQEALVEWNSLFIDRYDVRHLLSSPPPPRKRRRHPSSPMLNPDGHLESELDVERFLDLPPPSPSPSETQDGENGEKPMNAGGYNAVPFSYGDTGESTEQKDTDADSGFRPPFPVPESLLQNLPSTEKVHQIIARTATFVSKHGGQSEIVLRVKQGDNPTFGFLMPDHSLHPYFRFLVDHQELLSGKSLEEGIKSETGCIGGGGALSLLGTVYGSGEDEEGTALDASEHERNTSVEAGSTNKTLQSGAEQKESSLSPDEKDKTVPKNLLPLKDKAFMLKKNRLVSTSKSGTPSGMKKDNDNSAADKSRASALPPTLRVELPVVEPPSDLKRVVDKIVEFIMKNGREFESVLAEQDVEHGKFPFLLPSNQYHPYYLKVLQKAEESKLTGKGIIYERHNSSSLGAEKKASRENVVSVGSDIPYDSDRKGKFKMVIGKAKKDGQDSPSKAAQPQIGVSVDAAVAAAILQAATRGIKNPHLEILSKTSLNGSSQTPSSEGVPTSSSGGQLCHPSEKRGEPSVTAPIANAIAKTAAIAAASEADSSEASLSKEQKLKAERLKRAKMFAAMIKSGAAPPKTEPLRDLSLEPPESRHSGSGKDGINVLGKEREGSSQQPEVDTTDKTEKYEKKYSGSEHRERRSKRKYRSRSEQHEEDDDGQEEEAEDEKGRDRKHSRKKRRSRHSLDHSRDRHKHKKRHSSSKDRDTGFRQKHGGRSDGEDGHKNDRSPDDEEYQSSHYNRKHDKLSDGEHQRSQHRRSYDNSSDDEYRRSQHYRKQKSFYDNEHRHRRKRSHHSERETELEEGEIRAKSDQSKVSEGEGEGASREASLDISKSYTDGRAPSVPSDSTTTVSDDLRAKIRAMLMATL